MARALLIHLPLFALLVASCHDTSSVVRPGQDMGADGTGADLAVDAGDAAAPDLPRPDLRADQAAVDSAIADAAIPDMAQPDAAVPDQAIADAALHDAALHDAAGPDAAVLKPLTGFCSKDKWCWVNPLPQGNGINALWASSKGEVVAAGAYGTLMRHDGSGWSQDVSPVTYDLFGLWGGSGGTMYAVGAKGTLLYYNTVTWAKLSPGTTQDLRAVWSDGAKAIFAVGGIGTVARFDSGAWKVSIPGKGAALNAVWGSSASDVYAAGNLGELLKWGGSSWSSVSSGTPNNLRAIWGSGASDIWAVGDKGAVVRSTGGAWSVQKSPGSTYDLVGIWGDGKGTMYLAAATGEVFKGGAAGWTQLPAFKTKYTLAAMASHAGALLVAGQAGQVRRLQGSGWQALTGAATVGDLRGVWGSSETNIYAVGEGAIRFDGKTWTPINNGAQATMRTVWGSGPKDVFVGDEKGQIVHYDGKWTPQSSGTKGIIYSIMGSGPKDVHAVASSGIHRYDGMFWTKLQIGQTKNAFRDLWVVGASLAYAVKSGSPGFLWRWDGAVWKSYYSTGNPSAVWASGPSNILVSYNSIVTTRHYTNSTWKVSYTGISGALGGPFQDMYGNKPNAVVGVGATGALAMFNGTSWSPHASGSGHALRCAWISPKGNAYVVGENGTILRRAAIAP